MKSADPVDASSPDAQLVVVARFDTNMEADLAKLVLEADGIQTFLGGAKFVGTAWHLGTAVGHITVEVTAADESRARQALQAEMPRLFLSENSTITESNRHECLACRAEMSATQSQCEHCGWTYGTDDGGDEPVGFRFSERLRSFKRPLLGFWVFSVLAIFAVGFLGILRSFLQADRVDVTAFLVFGVVVFVTLAIVASIVHTLQDRENPP